MSYDPIDEVNSIDELIDEYGMRSHNDPANPYETMQVELLEALNQIGPQTLDDTKKRNAFWSIIRTIAILQKQGANGSSFTTEQLPAEAGLPSTQSDRHSKVTLDDTHESIIH